MAEPTRQTMTVDEFLRWERQQPLRYEFDGMVPQAMTGGTLGHNRIVQNLARALADRLAGRGCAVFTESAKVRIDSSVRYPDVVVTCQPVRDRDDVVPDPVIIAEVLSDSTASNDRGEKFADYRRIASMRHYLLISQSKASIEIFTRQGDLWAIAGYHGLAADIPLEALDVTLPSAEIYRDTEVAAA